jgi:hypothetical protein
MELGEDMSISCVRMKKNWEDVDFFELQIELLGLGCKVNIDIYTSNDDLEELRKGIERFIISPNVPFAWISGADNKNVTHYINFKFFLHHLRGYVGVEVIVDNNKAKPYNMRSNFFIITEIGQLDDFSNKLEKFIKGETYEIEGLALSLP